MTQTGFAPPCPEGIAPCIPGRRGRKAPVAYDKELCNQRHKIEIMFGRLKD